MGITSSDIKLIEKALEIQPDIKSVIELGSQNLYIDGNPMDKPPFASEWYKSKGMKYCCIDMAGDNEALQLDLSQPIELFHKLGEVPIKNTYDLVTDFGTSEHVVHNIEMKPVSFHEGHIHSVYPSRTPRQHDIETGYYNCWVNKHSLLNDGGIMINVNPKTKNWEGHGYTYINKDFYLHLAYLMNYEILLLEEEPAMGNPNAVNIQCILKTHNKYQEFISIEEFKTCPQFKS